MRGGQFFWLTWKNWISRTKMVFLLMKIFESTKSIQSVIRTFHFKTNIKKRFLWETLKFFNLTRMEVYFLEFSKKILMELTAVKSLWHSQILFYGKIVEFLYSSFFSLILKWHENHDRQIYGTFSHDYKKIGLQKWYRPYNRQKVLW